MERTITVCGCSKSVNNVNFEIGCEKKYGYLTKIGDPCKEV